MASHNASYRGSSTCAPSAYSNPATLMYTRWCWMKISRQRKSFRRCLSHTLRLPIIFAMVVIWEIYKIVSRLWLWVANFFLSLSRDICLLSNHFYSLEKTKEIYCLLKMCTRTSDRGNLFIHRHWGGISPLLVVVWSIENLLQTN